jgi:prevent-host-death family protein
MRTVEVTKATLPLAEYTKEVVKEPVIVTSKGRPVAALVNIPNADIETVALSQNQQFLSLIERSRSRQGKEGGFSTEQMPQRLRKKSAEPLERKR